MSSRARRKAKYREDEYKRPNLKDQQIEHGMLRTMHRLNLHVDEDMLDYEKLVKAMQKHIKGTHEKQ